MTDGKGGVEATAVMPDPLVQIGKADLPFTVSKEATPPPAPSSRQSVLPFTGLTYPSELALDAAGAAYLSDTWNDRVLKLAAGSNEQTMLPVTGLKTPGDLAVDTAGNVYVADGHNNRVLKLAAEDS